MGVVIAVAGSAAAHVLWLPRGAALALIVPVVN